VSWNSGDQEEVRVIGIRLVKQMLTLMPSRYSLNARWYLECNEIPIRFTR
jgi:hypothetical protein